MALRTELGKKAALEALKERREANKARKRIDNASLRAGQLMYFYCIVCAEEMAVPENYMTRPKLCRECQAIKDCGWLE
ncbi:MAG: hypothetical protein A2754_02440 [Candidatus Magasanikbacteria bacterium RIFCSPHIGHO2_01_FULL_47_8]|uniref:Uncharacterized protein n=1 Tax=Candidatus Magasanikbacteria bacterium RIFCSPHIGHO2_01_FULL_47_8 TaxID=1798673 RepID=A0A1F6MB36_9BACT|nr:MAG: hypothetical protein A2754_02440 [Candidatus Magasanikbacteria bacterium RIFCSPHIGHO2_01_FULL_47_8]